MMNNHHNHVGNHHSKTRSDVTQVYSDEEAPLNKKLPKELLLRIFSFLDVVTLCRCAQVSRYWNLLALDGSNWQRVDLFSFQRDVEGPVVENIAKRCGGFLKSLSLRGCQSITDAALTTFAQQCRNIEKLSLTECKKITDITCESLGRYCFKLMYLDLSSCALITNNSLKSLSDGCPNLEYLNISWCSRLNNDGVEALAKGCKKLTSFLCKGCLQISDGGIAHLAENCPDLKTINLHSCSQVTDEAVHSLSDHCHDLQFLCVSQCSQLTDASLVALGQGCRDLRTLEVAACSQFTDHGFQALAKQNCNSLQKMDLEDCVLLSALTHFAQICVQNQFLHELVYICPSRYLHTYLCKITDATLGHLALHCPRLTTLTLSHCELITDEGIRHLGGSPCATEHLQVLELDNCPLITDASLDHLMGCQGLERIELYDCQLITRAGIRKLRMHLPSIRVHAYFAPVTPPASVGGGRQRYCRCCTIL